MFSWSPCMNDGRTVECRLFLVQSIMFYLLGRVLQLSAAIQLKNIRYCLKKKLVQCALSSDKLYKIFIKRDMYFIYLSILIVFFFYNNTSLKNIRKHTKKTFLLVKVLVCFITFFYSIWKIKKQKSLLFLKLFYVVFTRKKILTDITSILRSNLWI